MYSLLDGFGTPEEMLKRAKDIGLKAYAITEHGNEYSWVYFDKLHKEFPDVKLIFGVELYECFDITVKDKGTKYFHLIALAKNEEGRKALNKIVTKSNLEGFYYKPRVEIADIIPYAENLVISTACLASKIARESDYQTCVTYVQEYKKYFPHFYLEMQSHSHEEQAEYNKKILQLSHDTNTPFIITTDSHAATKEDLYYQGRHVQIAHDSETLTEVYEGCYLQSEKEIHAIMDKQIGRDNVQLGLDNTNLVADLIEEVHMPFQSPQLPNYPLPDEFKDNYEYLKHLVSQGWKTRKFNEMPAADQKQYRERIEYELNIIHEMGFDGYFIIVWDFINYAKTHGVKLGAGRGSGAGSLVCFTIGITNLNPIKYGLIFERFLNPERISMPDLDIDVSDRQIVIDYLINKYGVNRVCQIINFSYITPVVAIKDVGKVLGFPYKEMDKLSKRFTYDTFSQSLENNPELLLDHPNYAELFRIAGKLSGRIKTVSTHAGGVGIVNTDVSDYMAMKVGKTGNEHVIQVDKKIVESIGIIKFDILGVQTLNLVAEVQKDLNISDWEIDINNPDFEYDKQSYELLCKAQTNGIFQVESAGMKDLLVRLQPTQMDELAAILALYRPDSMGEIHDFIERKHGRQEITAIHPDMAPILKSTYGCLIYQEELLEIVRKFGGRSYGGADLFRRAIGKKDKELVRTESEKLFEEIKATGYTEDIARQISEQMADKGGYLFNSSHAYSYAVLCLQTAYLKTHYPVYFYKALLNLNKDKTGMLNKYILDSQQFNIRVLHPSLNRSQINFSVYNDSVLFGLSAICGIGETVAKEIIDERNTHGKFENFKDFLNRVPVKKSQIISLTKAGAVPTKNKKDFLVGYLKSLYEPLKFKPIAKLPTYAEVILKYDIDIEQFRIGDKKHDYDKAQLLIEVNKKKEQEFAEKEEQRFQSYIEKNQKYLDDEEFWEFQALQIFLKDNPFQKATEYLSMQLDDIENGEQCVVVGVIAGIQKKKDKNKNQYAFVNIYSFFGLIEATIWSSQYKRYEDLIKRGSKIAIFCTKQSEESVIVDNMKSYDKWLEQQQKSR